MKAVKYTEYGSPEVLKFVEMEKPVIEENEVLLRIHATTVTSGDVRQRIGSKDSLPMWPISKLAIGFFKPKKHMLGFDVAGQIEAVGSQVTKFKVGDKVFGLAGGTNVEYRSFSEDKGLVPMPKNMSYAEATSIPFGAATAKYFLEKANIQPGNKVLVYGASGAVGTFAVQLAKYYGAEVTGVCSAKNVDLVKSLGADHVIDYKKEDFTKSNTSYDIVFDTLGKVTYGQVKKSLNPGGSFLMTVFGFKGIIQGLWTSVFGKKKVIVGVASDTMEGLRFFTKLAEEGHIKPVIDSQYAFDDIRKAHARVEGGHKRGNVVVDIVSNS